MEKLKTKLWAISSAMLIAVSSWISPQPLHADTAEMPQINLDVLGNGLAMWQTTTAAGTHSIYYATKLLGFPWSSPLLLSNSTVDSFGPALAINETGNAAAAWLIVDSNLGITSLQASYYTRLLGTWSTPTTLSGNTKLVAQDYKLRIDKLNNILIVWSATDINTNNGNVFTNSATIGGNWSQAVQLY